MEHFDFTIKSRERSRNQMSNPNVSWTIDDATCSSGHQIFSLAGPYKGENLTMRDTFVPGFAELQRKGFTIVNSMTKSRSYASATGQGPKVTYKANSCSSPVKHKVTDYPEPSSLQLQFGSVSFWYTPATLLAQSDIDDALNVAATQAWADSRNNSADVLQDIAEYRQTLGLLRDPLQLSNRYLDRVWNSKLGRAAVSSRLGQTKARLDWLTSMWLQFRFGVRPLLGSIQGVAEALKRDGLKHRRTARGTYNLSKQFVETGELQYPGSNLGGCRTKWTRTHTDEVSVRCGVLTEEATDFAGSIGIDASGLLALPWELLPYSFVADWFANTGTYLNALVPYYTKRPLQTWNTIRRTRTVVIQYHDAYIPISTTATLNRPATDTFVFTEETFSRAAGVPGPVVSFKPQALERVLSDARTLDGLALISNKIRRLSR